MTVVGKSLPGLKKNNRTQILGVTGTVTSISLINIFIGSTKMKQSKLVKKMYQACLEHDVGRQRELTLIEYSKIFKRKHAGKYFTPKWTIIR
jgi:hypothetical protein